jgi:hypothetical protein
LFAGVLSVPEERRVFPVARLAEDVMRTSCVVDLIFQP